MSTRIGSMARTASAIAAIPPPKRKPEREDAVDAILRLARGRARPDPGHARAADQYRACARARSEARGADRPLRGDGRRALLRGQCDAGGRIQHLGRSGGGARRLPLEAQHRDGRLARLARRRPSCRTTRSRRSRRSARRRPNSPSNRTARAREAYRVQTGEIGLSLADPTAMAVALDRSIGLSWSRHRVAIEMRQRAHPRHDRRRPAERAARRQQRPGLEEPRPASTKAPTSSGPSTRAGSRLC